MVDADAKRLAEKVIRDALDPYGIRHVEMAPGWDYDDGREYLDIKVHYRPDGRLPSARDSIDTLVRVNETLVAAGDNRFARVTHYSADAA